MYGTLLVQWPAGGILTGFRRMPPKGGLGCVTTLTVDHYQVQYRAFQTRTLRKATSNRKVYWLPSPGNVKAAGVGGGALGLTSFSQITFFGEEAADCWTIPVLGPGRLLRNCEKIRY